MATGLVEVVRACECLSEVTAGFMQWYFSHPPGGQSLRESGRVRETERFDVIRDEEKARQVAELSFWRRKEKHLLLQ